MEKTLLVVEAGIATDLKRTLERLGYRATARAMPPALERRIFDAVAAFDRDEPQEVFQAMHEGVPLPVRRP